MTYKWCCFACGHNWATETRPTPDDCPTCKRSYSVQMTDETRRALQAR